MLMPPRSSPPAPTALRLRRRSLAPRRRAGGGAGAARRGRRLPCARPRPPRGLVAGARPRRHAAAALRRRRRRAGSEPEVALTPMTAGREVVEDYRAVGLSLRAHPLAFLRAISTGAAIVTCAALRDDEGRRQGPRRRPRPRPPAARRRQGVMFITIEDETGIANRRLARSSRRSAASSSPRR